MWIPPHTGLPAHCTDITPPDIPAACVAVFDSSKTTWSLVEDHRGKTVFNTRSGLAVYISELGPLPENTTILAPDGQYLKWDGNAWVKDEAAEKAAQLREAESKKSSLMQQANDNIAPLQDAADLGMATESKKQKLADWKKYRVLLSRVDTSTAPNLEWPTKLE